MSATTRGTSTTIFLGTVLCLLTAWGCSGDGENTGGGVNIGGLCKDDGLCDGDYQGTISGTADTTACSGHRVIFTLTGNTVEFSEFEADCDLAPCSSCKTSHTSSSSIDEDTCTFSWSHLGSFSMSVSGQLDRSTCEFTGSYSYGGPPSCPCLDTGSWTASR